MLQEIIDQNRLPFASVPEDVGMSLERLEKTVPMLQKIIDEHRLPFARIMVSRKGRLVFDRRLDGVLPKGRLDNAVYRLYSLTKIFVSVAFGILMEKHSVQLDDAVADYLGDAWRSQQVHVSGGEQGGPPAVFEPASRPVTLRDCLTHTGGLVYGGLLGLFGVLSYSDGVMIEQGIGVPNLTTKEGVDAWVKNVRTLEKHCDLLAKVPLKFQPGTSYEYAVGHIVIGRVIEVASGMPLKVFMQKEVLDPLGCSASWLSKAKSDLLPLFQFKGNLEDPPRPHFECFDSGIVDIGSEGFATMQHHDGFRELDAFVFGDGQMVGTADDVMRLCELLTHRGCTVSGKRLLSKATASLIMSNCLPNGTGLKWTYMPPFSPQTHLSPIGPLLASFDEDAATGYGLGGLVHRNGAPAKLGSVAASPGAYHWNGAAGTLLQADPAKDLSIVFMTQLAMGHDTVELCSCGTLFQRIYQAIED